MTERAMRCGKLQFTFRKAGGHVMDANSRTARSTTPMCYLRAHGIVTSADADGVVLLHLSSGRMFVSTGSGARLWHRLNEPQRLDALVGDMASHFGLPHATAFADVCSFLDVLEQHHLIRSVAEA
jgi:hypothetical protein